jgi:tryptophan halogenase
MNIPDSLAHKINLYESRGHIVMLDNESFKEASWLAMYNGFNRTPQRYDIRADAVDPLLIKQKLDQMHQSINKAAQQVLSHEDFIKAHCQALS